MEDNKKSLYFGWFATSALITVAIAFMISGSLAGASSGEALFDLFIIYFIVLFLWILPFILLRAAVSTLRDRMKGKEAQKRSV